MCARPYQLPTAGVLASQRRCGPGPGPRPSHGPGRRPTTRRLPRQHRHPPHHRACQILFATSFNAFATPVS
jgi:hypothetical protein